MDRMQPINLTGSAYTLSKEAHGGTTITVNRAAGTTLTLPASSGDGSVFDIVVGTTITSNSTIVKVANSTDVMTGTAIMGQDAADTAVLFETAATSDTITLNGSTTGGIKGDRIRVQDVSSGLWHVSVIGSATGTEATPFSATV